MIKFLAVGAGGFLGSVFRYLIGGLVYRLSGNHWFPFGTLAVNVLGCLLIGVLGGYFAGRTDHGEEAQLFLMVGLLGGFTTFSSFGHETMGLLRNSQAAAAYANVFFQVLMCLLAAWAGHHISKFI